MPQVALVYWLAISLLSVVVTCRDKRAAKKKKRRIPEATLMALAALGGASAMLATMKIIRHKTQKPKFMIGIPLLIVLHIALIVGAWYVAQNGLPVIG